MKDPDHHRRRERRVWRLYRSPEDRAGPRRRCSSLRLNQAYDRDAGAKDIKDTVNTVAKLPECTGKVGVLGYCIGGLMTFLTAVRYRVDAAVAYHGGDTEKYLGEANPT